MTEEGKRKANKIGWIIILALVALLIAGIVAGEIIKYEERNRPPYMTVVKMYDAYTGEELGRLEGKPWPNDEAYIVLEEPVHIRADDPRTPILKFFYIDKRGNEQELAPIMEKDPKRFSVGYLFHVEEVDEEFKDAPLKMYEAWEPYAVGGIHSLVGTFSHSLGDYERLYFGFTYKLEVI
jgi:hypothetical protein